MIACREYMENNNETDIAIKPAAGLKPRKFNNAEIGTTLRGSVDANSFAMTVYIYTYTSKNKQVILEEYQPHKSILTEPVKVKFAIKPAKTDSLSPTVVT